MNRGVNLNLARGRTTRAQTTCRFHCLGVIVFDINARLHGFLTAWFEDTRLSKAELFPGTRTFVKGATSGGKARKPTQRGFAPALLPSQ